MTDTQLEESDGEAGMTATGSGRITTLETALQTFLDLDLNV